MHLFETLIDVDSRFSYRKSSELGAYVEGVREGPSGASYQLCGLTGEPLPWDERWHRRTLFERAQLAQHVDGVARVRVLGTFTMETKL